MIIAVGYEMRRSGRKLFNAAGDRWPSCASASESVEGHTIAVHYQIQRDDHEE